MSLWAKQRSRMEMLGILVVVLLNPAAVRRMEVLRRMMLTAITCLNWKQQCMLCALWRCRRRSPGMCVVYSMQAHF
jgi:hypothetical protein